MDMNCPWMIPLHKRAKNSGFFLSIAWFGKKSKGHTDLKNTHLILSETRSHSLSGCMTVTECDGSIKTNESLRGLINCTFEESKIILNQTIAHLTSQCILFIFV